MNSYENCTLKLVSTGSNLRKTSKKLTISGFIKAGLGGACSGLGAATIRNANLFNDISKFIPINSGYAIGVGLILVGGCLAISAGNDTGKAWGINKLIETNDSLIDICQALNKKEEN